MVSVHFLGAPLKHGAPNELGALEKLFCVRYPHSADNFFELTLCCYSIKMVAVNQNNHIRNI